MSTKERLLSCLNENRGTWVSGEEISNSMAVSRSAIWKHVQKLRQGGYRIESSPNRGYRLLQAPDLLLPEEIRNGLKTRVFGREAIHHFLETDSTNINAREYAGRGATEGTLVIAENQTKGRGRKGRTWFSSSSGGIYLSLILRPKISPADSPKITLLTAVALVEALSPMTGLEIRIKWPNDLLVHGKKLAGILTEMSADMDIVNYIVVGLGVNVNTGRFPEDIRYKATSLFLETGEIFSRIQVLGEFLRSFEDLYELFLRGGFTPLLDRWKKMSDIIGKKIKVEMIDQTYTGTVQDIDQDGGLILRDATGRNLRIISGEITLL